MSRKEIKGKARSITQLLAFSCQSISVLSVWTDFDPVAIWVSDKIDPHTLVAIADAPHLLVLLVSGFVIVHAEGQMEFTLAQVIFLRMIPHPGQLQLKISCVICHVHDDVGAVSRFIASDFSQAQRFFVKRKGLFQVGYIVVS